MGMTLLREARQEQQKSLRSVAVAVGVDPGTLSRIERGETTPSRETARSLFQYFGGRVPYVSCLDPAYRESVS